MTGSASLWGSSGTPNMNVSGTIVPQSFVGTVGQVLFALTAFTYTPGTNSLLVFVNGNLQITGRDYTETSSTSFTLTQGVVAGDYVDVFGVPGVSATATTLTPTQLVGLSGTTTAAANLRGTATFVASTTYNVVFANPEADANYFVAHSGNAAGYISVSAKTKNGFTLTCSASNSNSTDWILVR